MKTRSISLASVIGILLIAVTACASSNEDPLNGTTWTLASSDGTPPIAGTTITMIFEDGNIGGSSGCNSYGGTYQLNDKKIQIGEVTSTLMACTEPEDVMEQEGIFLSDLNNAQTFQLIGDQLNITTSQGKNLTFNPQ